MRIKIMLASGLALIAIAVFAALLGVGGVALIFGRELWSVSSDGSEWRGLLLAFGATVVASFGNMVATRNHRRGLPVHGQRTQTNARTRKGKKKTVAGKKKAGKK